MSSGWFSIASGGEWRLRQAIETKVRQAHAEALARATDAKQKDVIEEQIRREIKEEMKQLSSPYSLWSS